jgi:1-acyl-sn-glycerol-3-phosphate acyltransferase
MVLIRILRSLFGIYALIVFACTVVIVLPMYVVIFAVFSKEKNPHIAHYVSRYWSVFLFIMFFIRIKIYGSENKDLNKTYVIVANHNSQLDIPLAAIVCKNTFRFLAKKELSKIPLLGWIISKLYVLVDRSKTANRSKSIEAMTYSLRENVSMFIFPEGTRNRTKEPLIHFHDGAFKLAVQSQTPIIILTMIGTRELLSPLRPIELRPGKTIAVWSGPIETAGLTNTDVPVLKEQTRKIVLENLEKYSAGIK